MVARSQTRILSPQSLTLCQLAELTVQIINEMKRRDVQFGLVTMCIGGGMGAADIFERLQ
jgi:hypothetical protein